MKTYTTFGRHIRFLFLAIMLFAMSGWVRAEAPVISLTGVMYSQNIPSAYIDGKLMKEGEEVAGCEIIKIRHAGIHVKAGNGTIYYVPVANPSGIKEVESVDKIPSMASTIRAANSEGAGRVEIVSAELEEQDVEASDEWQGGASVMRSEPKASQEEHQQKTLPGQDNLSNVKMYAALGLLGLAMLISFISSIWYLIACFMESIWWGLGGLFIPFVQLIFLFVHWERAKKPFLLGLLATVMMVAAILLSPDTVLSLYDY